MRTVVLVHGAWHGPWCWASVLAGLDEVGVPAVAVELPLAGLHHDADHLRGVLDGIEGGVVLVGHSYGGGVITDAGSHPAVERLVYVCAFAPDETQTILEQATSWPEESDLGPAIRFSDDGTTCTVDPTMVGDILYGDCEPEDVERAVGLLRPLATACFAEAPRSAAWRETPSTYVVCGQDRAVHPGLQRHMAGRLSEGAVVELPDASHSPFLSQPGAVVEVLAGVAAP
jgi:pimeloyl-ACP methyl ester carboxylesterase